MKRRDVNQIAFDTFQQAIGAAPKVKSGENKEAAELGKLGGLKGGIRRAAVLTDEQRTAIAKKASEARWTKKK